MATDGRLQSPGFWGGRKGYGRYTYRYRHVDTSPEGRMLAEAEAAGVGWTPLLGGLFGGDSGRAIAALTEVKDIAGSIRGGRW